MKKLIICLLSVIMAACMLCACGRYGEEAVTLPADPDDTQITYPETEDGVVDDTDGLIGNEGAEGETGGGSPMTKGYSSRSQRDDAGTANGSDTGSNMSGSASMAK